MPKLLRTGHGNFVPAEKVLAISTVCQNRMSAPLARLVAAAMDENRVIDHTMGRRTRAVIHLEGGFVVLSALKAKTLEARMEAK